MANSHELPQEILLEIFSYLPTKSVGKFRCLSQTWNSDLSTPQFINLHQTRKTHQDYLISISEYGFFQITTPSINFPMSFSRIIFQLGHGWTKVFGSYNGLVLLEKEGKYEYATFLVNPITRKQVQIPKPPSGGEKSILYGFGYDRSCDDYKVIALSLEFGKETLDVYSLKTRVWKNVGHTPYECNIGSDTVLVLYVNGAMHWFAMRGCDDHICAFDLATESFHEILLPKERKPENKYKRLVVLKGCLAIVECFYYDYSSVYVWMMKEYGVEDSWVRLYIDNKISWRDMGPAIKPVCFVGDEVILCSINIGRWVVYDLKKGVGSEMVACPGHDSYLGCVVFEESLVSPNQYHNSTLMNYIASPIRGGSH